MVASWWRPLYSAMPIFPYCNLACLTILRANPIGSLDLFLQTTGLAVATETLNALRVGPAPAQCLSYSTVENRLLARRNTAGVFLKALVFWVKLLKDRVVNSRKFG